SRAYEKPHTRWQRPAAFTGRMPYTKYTQPPRVRIRWKRVAGLVVALAALVAAVDHGLQVSSSSTGESPISIPHIDRGSGGGLGEAGGAVPDGTTVFDDDVPAVAKLDPDLLKALQRAATDAGFDGVRFVVNGGWRSPEYEDELRREAVKKYGSEEAAARW